MALLSKATGSLILTEPMNGLRFASNSSLGSGEGAMDNCTFHYLRAHYEDQATRRPKRVDSHSLPGMILSPDPVASISSLPGFFSPHLSRPCTPL